jgi:hypothetical protein
MSVGTKPAHKSHRRKTFADWVGSDQSQDGDNGDVLGGIPGERPRSGGLVSPFCSNMARRFLTALIVAVLGATTAQRDWEDGYAGDVMSPRESERRLTLRCCVSSSGSRDHAKILIPLFLTSGGAGCREKGEEESRERRAEEASPRRATRTNGADVSLSTK